MAKYGCCLTFNSRAGVVTQKWGTCEFNVTNTCPSLLPQCADTVPITQCQESESRNFFDRFSRKGLCETRISYTQDLINKATNNTCFETRIRYSLNAYLHCENNGTEYCYSNPSKFFSDTPIASGLISSIRQSCNLSSNCTSECRE